MKLTRIFARPRPSVQPIPQPATSPQDSVADSPANASTTQIPLALRPRPQRPRAHGVDMVVITHDGDLAVRSKNYYVAGERYEAAATKYPQAGLPALKLLLLARLRRVGVDENMFKERLLALVPSPFERATLWTGLYWDRPDCASHTLFGQSLRGLLAQSGASTLLASERLLLLQRSGAKGDDLLMRALLLGSDDDLRAMLEFLEPCASAMVARNNELLIECIDRSRARPGKTRALLEAGARPQSPEDWDRVAALAIGASDEQLLRTALNCGLSPGRVITNARGSWSLMQGAASDEDNALAKITALAKAGASLTDTPVGTKVLSPLRAVARFGPRGLRHLIDLGLPVDAKDPHSGNTALHDMIEDDQVACIEPLLRAGANPGVRRPDGADAVQLATALAHVKCLLRLQRYTEVAKWTAYVSDADTPIETVDALAEILYRVPPASIATLVGMAEDIAHSVTAKKDAKIALTRSFLSCHAPLLGACDEARAHALERLRKSGDARSARHALEALCQYVPADKWSAFLYSLPWYNPGHNAFNHEVLVQCAKWYNLRGKAALRMFDCASYVPAHTRQEWAVGKLLDQFMRVVERDTIAAAWLSAWARRQKRADFFVLHLEETAKEYLKIDNELPDGFPALPKRKHYFAAPGDVAPAPAALAKLPKIKLPAALEEGLRLAPQASATCVSQRALDSLSHDDLLALHAALTDPDVEDDIVDINEVADAAMELIVRVLGADMVQTIYADAGTPTLTPTRRLFLNCHPDKVASELSQVAMDLTQLLTAIRSLITQQERGPKLSLAYARRSPGGAA